MQIIIWCPNQVHNLYQYLSKVDTDVTEKVSLYRSIDPLIDPVLNQLEQWRELIFDGAVAVKKYSSK